ncbi:LAME_0G16182g1_1 [Lachancea meyersii CBS 8951]|uniref:LAME_0G16182g1_1 n=1 Tax=Lachancea meyersii CBS 8951 TaxID=1266667 RepID=A0A1G4KB24_9SACH|nr:LAME_0G16182g1_1 [Lachancea meyersii CBS 8951]
MDYMNLGVTSRKTGIKIRQNIRKDEYSMENVDEFFKDNESSISFRRRSRKSSLLPFQKSILPEAFSGDSRRSSNFLPPSVPTIDENYSEPLLNEDAEPEVSVDNNWGAEEEAAVEEASAIVADNRFLPQQEEVKRAKRRRHYEPDYRGDEAEDEDSAVEIPQTPASDYGNESYRDVPDLIADDDDDEPSHGNTSFNTSENALLEDELDREYGSLSEEDGDYVNHPRYPDTGASSDSEGEGSESAYSSPNKRTLITSRRADLYVNRPTGTRNTGHSNQKESDNESSDDDFFQEQAQELGHEVNFSKVNGVRRSNRVKIAPLEYWRNEKVVYRRKSRKPVLEIDKVITFEEEEDEEEEELRKRKKGKNRPYNYTPSGRPRGRPRKDQNAAGGIRAASDNPNGQLISKIEAGQIHNSEWFEKGEFRAQVNVSSDHKKKEEDILARSDSHLIPDYKRSTSGDSYSLTVLFDKHKDTFASGFLTLPMGARKKPSDSYNVFINFYLIQGVVEMTVNQNKVICIEGCSFQVPAFNEYSILNKGKSVAKLYFVQVSLPTPNSVSNPSSFKPPNERRQDADMGSSLSDMSLSQS